MKKIISIILLVILSVLFLFSGTFKDWNIDQLTINEESVDRAVLLEMLSDLEEAKTIDSYDGYEFSGQLKYKFGSMEMIRLILNHDFSSVILGMNDEYYELDGSYVEYLYSMDTLSEVYDYVHFRDHTVSINQEKIEPKNEKKIKYLLADSMWYDMSELGEAYRIFLNSRSFDLQLESSASESYVVFNDERLEVQDFILPESSGVYELKIVSKWVDDLYEAETSTLLELVIDYPPSFTVSKKQMEQGDFTVISGKNIDHPELLFIETDYMDGLSFSYNGSTYDCVVPSTYYTTPGTYSIKIGEDEYEQTIDFTVVDREFEIQYLTVSSSTVASTQTDEGYAQYRKYYKAALLEDVYEPDEDYLIEKKFILPTTGRLTTEFGENRYVNNVKTSYHHAGWDIANDRGTPVVATYDGEVVLAMSLIVTGNSVVISHGNGIFSTYFHLDEFEVETGDIVRMGDPIGKMGTTGFSTGNHLHFSISYFQMNLEPGYFLYNERVTYDNYKQLFNQ